MNYLHLCADSATTLETTYEVIIVNDENIH
jgi:hypothetical protein